METIDALGFIEVYGLVPGIEAADAMVKSANVRLLRQYEVQPGLITIVVEGNLGACRAAIDAGTAAASRIGTVVAHHIIPRPDPDTENMVTTLISPPEPATKPGDGKTGKGKAAAAAPAKTVAPVVVAPVAPAAPVAPVAVVAPVAPVAPGAPGAPVTVEPGKVEKVEKKAVAGIDLSAVVAFIGSSTRGKNWSDIARQFPGEAKPLRTALDTAVKAGTLQKVGARYLAPGTR